MQTASSEANSIDSFFQNHLKISPHICKSQEQSHQTQCEYRFLYVWVFFCQNRRKKRAAKEAGHKRHGRGRNNAQVQPENHYIHRQRPGHHDNRDRSHHDLSGRLPRDRLDTPRYPNRSGHVMTNEPEHKYESLKSGSHTYEDINSAYYLDVLPDLQNR